MGIFGKKDNEGFTILLPDGSVPHFGGDDDFNKFLEDLAITPEKYGKTEMPRIDMDAYMDASSLLMALGIGTSSHTEKIYAFGPIGISSLPGINAEMQGTAVATENYLIVRFPYGLGLNYFVAPYEEIQEVRSIGPMAVDLTFWNSRYHDKKGRHHLQDHTVFLACKTGKDGHANRRALSLWYTNAYMIKMQFPTKP